MSFCDINAGEKVADATGQLDGGCEVLVYQGATLAANIPASKPAFQQLSQDGVYQLVRLEGISDTRMFVS